MSHVYLNNQRISFFSNYIRWEAEVICSEISQHFANYPPGPANKIITESLRIINLLSDEMDEAEEEIREQFELMECLDEENLMVRMSFENMLEIRESILDEVYIIRRVVT